MKSDQKTSQQWFKCTNKVAKSDPSESLKKRKILELNIASRKEE